MGYFDLQSLVGTEIVETETLTAGSMGRAFRKIKWTVIEAYPHFVRVMRVTEDGRTIYGTFNIGTLITMGVFRKDGDYNG